MDRVEYQSLVVQDLVNLANDNELNLSPWYQRRSVWSNTQKSYLINTLFEGKPIPAIYIRHSIDLEREKSVKEVVDGQQRSRSIIDFVGGEFSSRHPRHKNKVFYQDLSAAERQSFLLTALPVGYLLGATDSDVIDIFGRINSVSKVLNSQEKRNALYSGEMKQFCLEQATSRLTFWRNYQVFTSNGIARMNEVQAVSDLVYNFIYGLSDFTQARLNNMYKEYDEEFSEYSQILGRLDFVFNRIVELSFDVVRDSIFNRWPVLFSLMIVIDRIKINDAPRLEDGIIEMNQRYYAPENINKNDREFKYACSTSTQRITQRKVRDKYIESFLGS